MVSNDAPRSPKDLPAKGIGSSWAELAAELEQLTTELALLPSMDAGMERQLHAARTTVHGRSTHSASHPAAVARQNPRRREPPCPLAALTPFMSPVRRLSALGKSQLASIRAMKAPSPVVSRAMMERRTSECPAGFCCSASGSGGPRRVLVDTFRCHAPPKQADFGNATESIFAVCSPQCHTRFPLVGGVMLVAAVSVARGRAAGTARHLRGVHSAPR